MSTTRGGGASCGQLVTLAGNATKTAAFTKTSSENRSTAVQQRLLCQSNRRHSGVWVLLLFRLWIDLRVALRSGRRIPGIGRVDRAARCERESGEHRLRLVLHLLLHLHEHVLRLLDIAGH